MSSHQDFRCDICVLSLGFTEPLEETMKEIKVEEHPAIEKRIIDIKSRYITVFINAIRHMMCILGEIWGRVVIVKLLE